MYSLRNISKVSICNLISYLFLTVFICGLARDLIFEIYDLDLDTEMYFGSRLFWRINIC